MESWFSNDSANFFDFSSSLIGNTREVESAWSNNNELPTSLREIFTRSEKSSLSSFESEKIQKKKNKTSRQLYIKILVLSIICKEHTFTQLFTTLDTSFTLF